MQEQTYTTWAKRKFWNRPLYRLRKHWRNAKDYAEDLHWAKVYRMRDANGVRTWKIPIRAIYEGRCKDNTPINKIAANLVRVQAQQAAFTAAGLY